MKMTKHLKAWAALLAATMLLACAAGCNGGGQATPATPAAPASGTEATPAAPTSSEPTFDGEILFGVTTGITGGEPDTGAAMVNCVTMACEEINAAGGVLGKKFVPVFEDDKFSAEGGLIAMQRLASRDDITAIIGFQKTASLMAAIDLVNIPTLVGMSSMSLYEADNPNVFRVYGSDPVIATAGGNWAIKKFSPKKIWVLNSTDDVGAGAGDVFEQVCKDNGIDFLHDTLNPGDRDFTGQILKAKDAGCDVLFLYVQAAEGVVLARQLHEFDFVIPTIGGASIGTTSFLSQCDP